MKVAEAFRAIDSYSRDKLNCFVAEFFPDRMHPGFHLLCFRPSNDIKVADEYACKYMSIADDELSACADRERSLQRSKGFFTRNCGLS